ncbi:MAG: ferredoxin oxidoreductase, partial [Synergistaceae bacterium]|nr:ferredoxin oxidoreductase [Synergistaceae bacterium]
VIVISEMSLALMRERLEIPPAQAIEIVNRKRTTKSPSEYLPFQADGEFGVPEFAELGTGYRVIHSINPHDERGDIEWDPKAFERLYRRITGKVRENRKKISTVQKFHLDDANIALVAYGSEARPALDAALMAREKGMKVGVLKLDVPWPFPEEEISDLAAAMGAIVTVEMNLGKYAAEIERAACGRCRTARATKNLGEPDTPEEILAVIEEVRA